MNAVPKKGITISLNPAFRPTNVVNGNIKPDKMNNGCSKVAIPKNKPASRANVITFLLWGMVRSLVTAKAKNTNPHKIPGSNPRLMHIMKT